MRGGRESPRYTSTTISDNGDRISERSWRYFVLKPKHSAFYLTSLDLLLRSLDVRTVILTGIAGNNCVLFSANDAYMRDLHLVVPPDCIVSNSAEENEYALKQMRTILKADVRPPSELTF